MNELFSQRLHSARIMRNLSMDHLCIKMGGIVSKQSISKYESGASVPNSTILMALCDALDVKPDYFFQQPPQIVHVSFRKLSKLPKKEEKSIREIVKDDVERYNEIETICGNEQHFDTSFPDVIVTAEADVYLLAGKLRDRWHLGNDAIGNIINLLEDNDIKVVEIDASLGFDGFSGWIDGDQPVIVLNKNMSAERKRFTALHEVGHIVMRFAEELAFSEKEHFCHLFASEVLIPCYEFKRLIGDHRHDISINELSSLQRQYGISIDALMYKAKYLGVISERRYKTFCIKKNADERLKRAVDLSIYAEEKSDRFENMVFMALSKELITMSKAAALLNKPVEEVANSFVLA